MKNDSENCECKENKSMMDNQTGNREREALKVIDDHDNQSLSIITARKTGTDRGTLPTETVEVELKSSTEKSRTSSIGVHSPVEASQRAETSQRAEASQRAELVDENYENLTHVSDQSHICEGLVSDSCKISEINLFPSEVKVHVDRRLLDKSVNYLLAAKESAMSILGTYGKGYEEDLNINRGQTFILQDHSNAYWLLTNKHVVCQNKDDNKIKTIYCNGAYKSKTNMVNFLEYKFITHAMVNEHVDGQGLDVPGGWGIDIASTKISQARRDVFSQVRLFKQCDSNFDYSVGTPIAIAINKAAGTEDVTLKKCKLPENSTINPNDFFGQESSVTILKGEITETGESYFLHNINSYEGCSGAAIFLLNDIAAGNDYPDDHQLTVIGVHAGHSMRKKMNYAFKIKVEEVPQPEGRKTLSAFLDEKNPSSKGNILSWLEEQGVHSLGMLCKKIEESGEAFWNDFYSCAGAGCLVGAARLLDSNK